MLGQLNDRASQCGLEMHPVKTKEMINATKKSGRRLETTLEINGRDIEILPRTGAIKYLSVQLCFDEPQQQVLNHRIRCAWAAFQSHNHELTGKTYGLADRLELFHAVVSLAFLYACSCWTLRKDHEAIINRTQRRMMRLILGAGRRRLLAEPLNQRESSQSDSGTDGCSDADKPPLRNMVQYLKNQKNYLNHGQSG